MEKTVHSGDGGGHQVPLLSVQTDVTPLLPLTTELGNAGEEHSPRTARGIVDRLARLRLEDLSHQVYDGTVGVELRSGVPCIVGKLLDEVFVPLTEFVFRQVSNGQFKCAEMLD